MGRAPRGLYPKIQDHHLPGKIFAKLPDSLAPEILQLLTPEFRIMLGGHAQSSTGVPPVFDSRPKALVQSP
jgi:hypothetical protein